MAVRWSNPSGGAGFQRFRVWPAGTDSYSHTDLSNNFDTLDNIIGNSPTVNWPPTLGLNGGIYAQIALLQANRQPIGTVFPWFRPTLAVPIPAGCSVCDGSTLAAADHDFPGGGSITLPNLINAFWLGADPNLPINQAGVAITDAGIDSASGAPGPQGTGGQNAHALTNTEIPTAAENTTSAQAMIGTSQSWPNVDPVFGSFLNGVTIQTSSGSKHENRPRYVGLIPLCRVKYVNTL